MNISVQDGASVSMPSPSVPVWDVAVRVFHWSVVTCILLALLVFDDGRLVHRWLGYTAAGLVAARLVWGVIGPLHARFTDFVVGPAALLGYVMDLLRGRERRYLGHNPLGGLMIIGLLTMILVVSGTGWLSTTDDFYGVAWVDNLHAFGADLLACLVVVHVAGVIFGSIRHRENLVGAMISGRKRA